MKNLVDSKFVFFDVEGESKEQIIRFLSEKFLEDERISDLDGYVGAVLEREENFSTAVGYSVATPHAKTDYATHATVAFARLQKEILWDEEENEKASIIFLLAIPTKDKGDRHLKILASLSRKLVHEEFRQKISEATKAEEVVALIDDID